jgi:hypothetical protein
MFIAFQIAGVVFNAIQKPIMDGLHNNDYNILD